MSTWVHPAGTAAHDGWDVRLPAGAELSYAGVAVRTLSPGERLELVPDGTERMLVPLDGAVEARVDGSTHVLGRAGDVMEAAPDVLYLPIDRRCDLRARDAGCRLLIASAPADEVHAVQLLPARDIPVEVRGEPPARRRVRDLGGEHVLRAQRLLVCEVLTPAGGWSSYPPHKHDTASPGTESVLEEIYYYEIRRSGPPAAHDRPVGYHRTFASDERELDVLAEVRSGDTVLVPYGWHGPCMAPPGYAMYYLNVMAGPGPERTWQVTFHPDYDWTRR